MTPMLIEKDSGITGDLRLIGLFIANSKEHISNVIQFLSR